MERRLAAILATDERDQDRDGKTEDCCTDSGDRFGDLEAQGEIGDLMAQVDELDRKYRLV